MGSFFSSSKYDIDIQQNSKITKQVKQNRAQSELNSRSYELGSEKQKTTKANLMAKINQQLGQSKNHPNYVLDAANEPHNNYHTRVLEGMNLLIYLKQRKSSELSDKFLVRYGVQLQNYIADFCRLYPEQKEIIKNLKKKFKAIYGFAYNKKF